MELEDIEINRFYLCIKGYHEDMINVGYYRALYKNNHRVVCATYYGEPEGLVPMAFLEAADEDFIAKYNTMEKLNKYVGEEYPHYFI